jgi:glycosyltransferase involved in cell wall biosynthesis
MLNIFHITPHLGGGVGQVLLNYVISDSTNRHLIASLDYANEKAIKYSSDNNFILFQNAFKNIPCLLQKLNRADIIVVHFWNHPLLYDFIINHVLAPARIIFWSHIAGFAPPYIFTKKMLKYPDKFIFSTPLSYNTENVSALKNTCNFGVVLSTSGIDLVQDVVPVKHSGFNVGYIGTVDYAKMHPDYIAVHKRINIEGINFIIVGGDNDKEIAKNADKRFHFIGRVDNIRPYLSQMDVFGYLLNKNHYGTGEQVLQEAMGAGIVPVVLNNATERFLVKHGEVGLVAKDVNEYIEYIELLYNDINFRCVLANNAKEYASKMFSLDRLIVDWNRIYDEVMSLPKKEHQYGYPYHLTAYELFLESIGEYKNLFVNQEELYIKKMLKQIQWQSNTKGTPKQYYSFFKNDYDLAQLCKLYD